MNIRLSSLIVAVAAVSEIFQGCPHAQGSESAQADKLRNRTIPIARIIVQVSSKDFGNYDLFIGGPANVTGFRTKYPDTRFLRYWSSITTPVDRRSSTDYYHFDHEWIAKEHPRWFLSKNKKGNASDLIEVTINVDKAGVRHVLDIGNSDFRSWAAQQIATQLSPDHAGVFLDNVMLAINNTFFSDPVPYSQEQWETYWLDYLSGVREVLKERGKILVINLGVHFDDAKWRTFLRRLPQVVDGIVDESFMSKGPGKLISESEWEVSLENHRLIGKTTIMDIMNASARSGAASEMLYTYTSALLSMGLNSYYAFDANPQQFDIWDRSIGKPTSEAMRLDSGMWWRSFTNGVVVVNPTQETHIYDVGGEAKDISTNEMFEQRHDIRMMPTTGRVLMWR